MTSEQFVYWLQGHLEISNTKSINEKELIIIRDHLALVFDKKTPNRLSTYFTTPQFGGSDPNFDVNAAGYNGPKLGLGTVSISC